MLIPLRECDKLNSRFCLQHNFCSQWLWVCISNLIIHTSCVTITNLTNTSGSISTGVIATAANYLPVARVWSHCVDADKSGSARLGQSTTLINIWYGETWSMWDKGEEREKRRRSPQAQRKDKKTRGYLFSHTMLWCQSKHTSHTCIPLDNFVVCVHVCVSDIFSILSFLKAFLLPSFYIGVCCLDVPQFLPLGANSTASVCTAGGQRIGFYPPLCNP